MPGSVVKIVCSKCGERVRVDVEAAKLTLKKNRKYGFGDHVTDERAFAMRLLSTKGWQYGGGRIAKSTLTMTCPKCLDPEPLVLDAD
jgi:hypothetical protein